MSEPTERELDAMLEQLEEEERSVSVQRRRLHDRMALFPNSETELDLTLQEAELSKRRRDIHHRIDEIRAQRNLLRDQRSRSVD